MSVLDSRYCRFLNYLNWGHLLQAQRLSTLPCRVQVLFSLFILSLGHVFFYESVSGNARDLTLPIWIFVGGLVGFIFGMVFLCIYFMDFALCNGECGTRRHDVTDELCALFFCCVCAMPAGVAIIGAFLFRIAWFICGLLLYSNLNQMCKTEFAPLANLGIVMFVAMAASSLAKFLVVSKRCPCDAK